VDGRRRRRRKKKKLGESREATSKIRVEMAKYEEREKLNKKLHILKRMDGS